MDTKARLIATRAVPWLAPRFWLAFAVLAIGGALAVLRPAAAQDAQVAQDQLVSAEELRELVGPIALYPDDLVAIVLPASTYPLQVVQAARLLEERKRDSSLKPSEDWDDSVVALLNYPEIIKLMNDDLDWTYDLGTAVLNQRADVLAAVQDFRDEAYAAGNLKSDDRQTVARTDEAIEIKPANPQVIYVPYYEPAQVVVYQPAPVYYYYPIAYPVYYYPYPAHYHFTTGFFWGVNTWFSIGWHSHYLNVYDPFYYGHPYYGWNYYNPFYVRNVYVNVNHYHNYPNNVWEPRYRYGGRPVTRSTEGRVYTARETRTTEGPVNPRRPGSPNPCSPCSPGGSDGTPPAGGDGTHGPRGRSTEARPPPGHSTQANENSNGRSTRTREPNGQPGGQNNHGQTHQPRAAGSTETAGTNPIGSANATRTQTVQGGALRGNGGTSPAAERYRAGTPSNSEPRTNPGQANANRGGGMSPAAERYRAAVTSNAEPGTSLSAGRANPQPNAQPRTSPSAGRANPSMARVNPSVSPRASERSTGMPQEYRGAPPRQQQSFEAAPPRQQQSFEAAPPRQQSYSAPPSHGNGGMSGATRSARGDAGGGGESYRGNSGGGGDGGSRGNSGGGNGGGSYRGGGGDGGNGGGHHGGGGGRTR